MVLSKEDRSKAASDSMAIFSHNGKIHVDEPGDRDSYLCRVIRESVYKIVDDLNDGGHGSLGLPEGHHIRFGVNMDKSGKLPMTIMICPMVLDTEMKGSSPCILETTFGDGDGPALKVVGAEGKPLDKEGLPERVSELVDCHLMPGLSMLHRTYFNTGDGGEEGGLEKS